MHDITLIWQYESPFERDWIQFLLGDFLVHQVKLELTRLANGRTVKAP